MLVMGNNDPMRLACMLFASEEKRAMFWLELMKTMDQYFFK